MGVRGLILLNALLVVVLLATWNPPELQISPIRPHLPSVDLPQRPLADPGGGEASQARPLFWPQRRPWEEAPTQGDDGFRVEGLKGLVGAGEQGVILFKREDGGIQRLRVGESIQGWRLVRIESTKAVLEAPSGELQHHPLPRHPDHGSAPSPSN